MAQPLSALAARQTMRSDLRLLVSTEQPYVRVEERIGSSEFVRCTADLFEADTLTITALDDDYVMRVYRPGTWKACTVYGPHGHPEFSFTAGTPIDPILSPKELRA